MGLLAAELLKCRNPRILSIQQKDMPMTAPRPVDVSLDSSKALSMGYSPEDITTALKKTIKMMGVDGIII